MRAIAVVLLLTGIAQAEEMTDEEIERLRNNPKAMAMALSVELCLAQDYRATALAEIAKEKKYSKLGGAVNKVRLYALQQRVRRGDEAIAKVMANMRTASNLKKVKLLPCSSQNVRDYMACKLDDGSISNCSDWFVSKVLYFVNTISDDE